MFGPKDIFRKRKNKRLVNNVAISPQLCWVNNLLMFFGSVASLFILYLQFYTKDNNYRELSFYGYLQYLMLGSVHESYVFALPPGLVLLFHLLSFFLSAFVIHFNKSSTSIGSFMSPLECQEKEISTFVHQLEDPKDPNCAPNTDIKETKL